MTRSKPPLSLSKAQAYKRIAVLERRCETQLGNLQSLRALRNLVLAENHELREQLRTLRDRAAARELLLDALLENASSPRATTQSTPAGTPEAG